MWNWSLVSLNPPPGEGVFCGPKMALEFFPLPPPTSVTCPPPPPPPQSYGLRLAVRNRYSNYLLGSNIFIPVQFDYINIHDRIAGPKVKNLENKKHFQTFYFSILQICTFFVYFTRIRLARQRGNFTEVLYKINPYFITWILNAFDRFPLLILVSSNGKS